MQIYYASIDLIEQTTIQLDSQSCIHCGKAQQMVSHGFIYKKQAHQQGLLIVGKRIICSRRYGRIGCGRTVQLYLDSAIKRLKHNSTVLLAFITSYIDGAKIEEAYQQQQKVNVNLRQAYRWLNRLVDSTTCHRSVCNIPEFGNPSAKPSANPSINSAANQVTNEFDSERVLKNSPNNASKRRSIIRTTFIALCNRFSQPLCSAYQNELQQSFL